MIQTKIITNKDHCDCLILMGETVLRTISPGGTAHYLTMDSQIKISKDQKIILIPLTSLGRSDRSGLELYYAPSSWENRPICIPIYNKDRSITPDLIPRVEFLDSPDTFIVRYSSDYIEINQFHRNDSIRRGYDVKLLASMNPRKLEEFIYA